MTAKPVSARVAELRKRRQDAGLTRLELYAHPDDHQEIKDVAAMAQKRREEKQNTDKTNA